MASNTSLIYVDHHSSNPISITTNAYEQIQAMIEANRACNSCGATFTEENPRVALNKCLKCVLDKHHGYTYKGLAHAGSYGNYYAFLDSDGYVYTTYQNSDDNNPQKSDYDTLQYYGFPTLTSYTYKGEEKALDISYWNIYGNFRENDVIVLTYHHSYAGLSLVFLSCKDGTITEMNRRMKEFRDLFKRAKDIGEATKDDKGYYHVGDYASSNLYESHLYMIISDIATKEYRTRILEDKEARVNELVHSWLKGDVDDNVLFEIIALYEQLGDPKNVHRFSMLLEKDVSA